jgi:diacylglycerol kinase family enzyme
MKYCIVANPNARNGRSRNRLNELQRELRAHRLQHELFLCPSLEQAEESSRAANLAGFDAVVGVGGDGTLNRVLNGFFDESGNRISGAAFGAIHIGTSPDFCRSYHIPTDLPAAVCALASGCTRRISVGRVIYQACAGIGTAAGRGSALFGCCANIGLGASLARLANAGVRKRLGDVLGTFLSLLRVLRRYRPHELEMDLDGQGHRLSRVYNVAVGKTFYVASGLKVHHELRACDDRLYVLTLQGLSWRNFLPVLVTLYSGAPIRSHGCLSFQYARSVRFTSPNATADVEFDGDPAGQCPCRIETAPDTLEVIVGENP